MRYVDLKDRMKLFTVFSLSDIRSVDSNFYRQRLNEWQDKGYIIKLIRGFYIFADLELNETTLFEISNRIHAPSYVSFEAALSHYGLIPESLYGITAASTRKTCAFKTKIASFEYRTVKKSLFFGYDLAQVGAKFIKIAYPEKAILDYFYINPSIKNEDAYESLRVNKEKYVQLIDGKRFSSFLKRFGQKSLARRAKSFEEFIKYA